MCKSLIAMLGILALWGCNDIQWQTKDISGLMPDLAFQLTDENGKAVSEANFKGKITLLFFGFTHCPGVCPTTLARLARVIKDVEAGTRDNLVVLFVSVDPARDDAHILSLYTQTFGDEFIGMTGDKAALDALTRRYRVTYGYGDKDSDGNYNVSHSNGVFAFDPQGQNKLLIRSSDTSEAVVSDLNQLANGG